jgi:hypothetical protein
MLYHHVRTRLDHEQEKVAVFYSDVVIFVHVHDATVFF